MPRRMTREPSNPSATAAAAEEDSHSAMAPVRPKKIDQVITLLRREQGAILTELIDATGWLSHTTRAALTGLKKKGHTIEKSKRGDVSCYRIVEGN